MQINLLTQFGDIDVYLFDQLLKGRIELGMRVLDAGCGGGRNLIYLLREGYAVYGVDQDPEAVEQVRRMASVLAPALPARNFQTAPLEAIPFDDGFFDVVICSAVLHFAANDGSFVPCSTAFGESCATAGCCFADWRHRLEWKKKLSKSPAVAFAA